MRWSAAIAGKTGKCKCGAVVRVPREIEPPAEVDLLDALAEPTAPVVEASIGYNTPPPAVPAVPLQYRAVRPTAAGNTAGKGLSPELLREFILPAVVLVLGFVAMMGWLSYHGSLVAVAVITVLFLATVAMVGKTLLLSLLAWYLASRSGGSLGNPFALILKIASLVVAADATIMWTWTAMVATGAITNRFYVFPTIFIMSLVTFVVAVLISMIVYGLQGEEVKLFGGFVSGGNLFINVLVIFILVMIGRSAANSAAQARLSPAVSVPPSGGSSVNTPSVNSSSVGNASAANSSTGNSSVPATAPSAPAPVALDNAIDRLIGMKLSKSGMQLMEGRDWVTSPQFRPQDRPIGQLITQMYNFRAPKVYVETRRGRAGLNAGIVVIDVELPASAQDREGCFSAVAGFQQTDKRSLVLPTLPTTGRYIEIRVAR